MDKFYKILEKLAYTIIFLVAFLITWSILPLQNVPKIFVVLSGSMEPAIHTGSVVVIKPVSQYKTGDIITFGKNTNKDIPTTHRIVSDRVENGIIFFTTKGDANNSSDVIEIPQKDIHGKVFLNIPLLGYVIDFVRKPLGMVIVLVLPAIFIVYDEIVKIISEIKKIRERGNSDKPPEND